MPGARGLFNVCGSNSTSNCRLPNGRILRLWIGPKYSSGWDLVSIPLWFRQTILNLRDDEESTKPRRPSPDGIGEKRASFKQQNAKIYVVSKFWKGNTGRTASAGPGSSSTC